MSFPQDPIVKIILIGDSGVGKTAFFSAFLDNTFSNVYVSTIGVDFCMKRITLDDETVVKLQLWDSAGMERFRSLTSTYFRGADVICLMYDISNRESFHNLSKWIRLVQTTTDEKFLFVIIANKNDLSLAHRQVSEEEGAIFASLLSAGFFETSAKTFFQVSEVFSFLAKEIVKHGIPKHQPRVLTLQDTSSIAETITYRKRWCGLF